MGILLGVGQGERARVLINNWKIVWVNSAYRCGFDHGFLCGSKEGFCLKRVLLLFVENFKNLKDLLAVEHLQLLLKRGVSFPAPTSYGSQQLLTLVPGGSDAPSWHP